MSDWKPTTETLRVLRQLGFPQDKIDKAVNEYPRLASKYPSVFSLDDSSFALSLKIEDVAEYVGRHRISTSWRPTKAQMGLLSAEGFCETLIKNCLEEFILDEISRPFHDITIDPFSRFRRRMHYRFGTKIT